MWGTQAPGIRIKNSEFSPTGVVQKRSMVENEELDRDSVAIAWILHFAALRSE
jgi:hypothetical protein